jgi:hypothetical protein
LVLNDILCTQYGHSTCALFVLPHALHLFKAVTSRRCFPEASNRCRFFICEVFFLGTALRSPSQRSPIIPGMGIVMAGSNDAESRRCWSSGIRRTGCEASGKSCARAMGRKEERKDDEGALNVAIAVCRGVYSRSCMDVFSSFNFYAKQNHCSTASSLLRSVQKFCSPFREMQPRRPWRTFSVLHPISHSFQPRLVPPRRQPIDSILFVSSTY